MPGHAQQDTATAAEIARVEQLYVSARQELASAETNVAFACQFGRAVFERAEFATNNTERASLAEQGIAACRRALRQKPDSAEAHYYLAMNLGQLARTKALGALRLVNEMESEFLMAQTLDPQMDNAGPDRNLGYLYFQAPGWPASVGSRTKARQHMRDAVEVAPKYPENRLALLEAYQHWGDRLGAQRELKAIEEVWPWARANLTGEAWTTAWRDWEKRLAACKRKEGDSPALLVSPRQKE